MIDQVLKFLLGRLNEDLRQRFGVAKKLAVLSPLGHHDRSAEANRILMTLVNIERVAAGRTAPRGCGGAGDSNGFFRLLVVVSARVDADYAQSLSLLSAAVGFFHATPLFTQQSSAKLPPELDRVTVTWRDLDLGETSRLWSMLGRSYQPSAVYQVDVQPAASNAGPPPPRVRKRRERT